MTRRPAAIITAILIVIVCCSTVPSAVASCSTDRPGPSPYAFVGTVIETKNDGYVATVITDGGRRVTVLGALDTDWSSSRSSVDRRFAVGARYEFHPTNASDPYRDNICTATRKLAGPDLSDGDDQDGPIGYIAVILSLSVAALGLVVMGGVLRRRSRRL